MLDRFAREPRRALRLQRALAVDRPAAFEAITRVTLGDVATACSRRGGLVARVARHLPEAQRAEGAYAAALRRDVRVLAAAPLREVVVGWRTRGPLGAVAAIALAARPGGCTISIELRLTARGALDAAAARLLWPGVRRVAAVVAGAWLDAVAVTAHAAARPHPTPADRG